MLIETHAKITIFQYISKHFFNQISILGMRFTDTNQINEIKLLENVQSKLYWKIH